MSNYVPIHKRRAKETFSAIHYTRLALSNFLRDNLDSFFNKHHFLLTLILHIMDRQSVYSLSVLAPDYSENNEDSRRQVQTQLQNFILEFRLENSFIYR